MTNNYSPVIELSSYRITNLTFKHYENKKDLEEFKEKHGELKADIGLTEDKKDALLKLSTTVVDESNSRVIEMTLAGQFSVNTDEKIDTYLSQNGTAILMPYLRTFISIISSLDNENSIVLPTVNTKNFE